ncbi:MAG: ArsR family transcriptional regulator [Pedosphaera sp.]|nr:ArsR family transcriptional regulator [Pedosphaera sp.]
MTELVAAAKALADPTRVRILAALRGRELCVCELCDALQVSQSTLSTHLQVIRDAGLVRTRKEGKWIYYAPAPGRERFTESVFTFFNAALRDDAHLRRDAGRVKERLAERDGGECCRGFEQQCCLKPKKR